MYYMTQFIRIIPTGVRYLMRHELCGLIDKR